MNVILKLDTVLEKYFGRKKWIVLGATAFVLVLILILCIPTNPLLRDLGVRHAGVLGLDSSNESYGFWIYSVTCTPEEFQSITEKQYIEFLKKGVEGRADEIGIYVIDEFDECDAIVYLNGNSSKGYHINCIYGQYTLTPTDGRCALKGIVSWDGTNLSYVPQSDGTRLGDVVNVGSAIAEKYREYD